MFVLIFYLNKQCHLDLLIEHYIASSKFFFKRFGSKAFFSKPSDLTSPNKYNCSNEPVYYYTMSCQMQAHGKYNQYCRIS